MSDTEVPTGQATNTRPESLRELFWAFTFLALQRFELCALVADEQPPGKDDDQQGKERAETDQLQGLHAALTRAPDARPTPNRKKIRISPKAA